MSPRLSVSRSGLLPSIVVAAILMLNVCGCSSTTSSFPASSATAASVGAAAATVTAEPPVLDLCALPALAPAALRAKPDYVEFAVSVIDANGAPITGLKQSDFIVREDTRQFPIAYFRETSAKTPTSLVIVGDTSSTMFNKTVVKSGKLSAVRAKLDKAAEDINGCNEVAVVLGGGEYAPGFEPAPFDLPPALPDPILLQPFTTDFGTGLMKMENVLPSGANRLPDEIKMALGQLDDAQYPDRALAIMTDGLDANAIDETVSVLKQARAKGIAVWIIGIGEPDASNGALAALRGTSRLEVGAVKRLAAAGNAQLLFARPVDDDGGASLAQAVSTIGKQLGQGYAIGVVASSPNAKPIIALAKPTGETLRAAIVPAQVLADAATRHFPPLPPRCDAVAHATPPATIKAKPGYTQIRVSVLDPDGKAVRDLKQSDFVVSSDSAQFPVVYSHEDRNGSPRSIVIAIDTSGSMEPKLGTVRHEIGKLLDSLNPCDEVALVAFSSKPFLLQALTTNHDLVKKRLGLLHAYGPTAIYDAIDASVEILAKGKYQDRTLILLTDGMDNVSKISKNQIVPAAKLNHVQIEAIGIGEPSKLQSMSFGPFSLGEGKDAVDKETLDSIAASTGGQDFIVPPMSKDAGRGFARVVATISERLENGYEIGFIASGAPATPTVTILNQPDYVVRIVGGEWSASSSPAAPTGK